MSDLPAVLQPEVEPEDPPAHPHRRQAQAAPRDCRTARVLRLSTHLWLRLRRPTRPGAADQGHDGQQ